MEFINKLLELWDVTFAPIVIAVLASVFVLSSKASESFETKRRSIWWIIFALGGTIAAIVSLLGALKTSKILGWNLDLPLRLISSAYAGNQDSPINAISLADWVVGGIFIMIFITFMASVLVMFLSADTAENKRKLAAADNIMKTFGGFFIGVATTFANQSLGGAG